MLPKHIGSTYADRPFAYLNINPYQIISSEGVLGHKVPENGGGLSVSWIA
jgi:hypothetical protein